MCNNQLNSLNCPTKQKQEEKWKQLFNKYNADNRIQIDQLLNSLNFKLFEAELNDENIVPYYKLRVLKDNKLGTELYLLLNDPHPFTESKIVTSKVAIINYLKNNSKIPVETILSYSNEYILIEKIKGIALKDAFQSSDQMPDELIIQIIDIYRELKSIQIDTISYFDKDMKIVSYLTN